MTGALADEDLHNLQGPNSSDNQRQGGLILLLISSALTLLIIATPLRRYGCQRTQRPVPTRTVSPKPTTVQLVGEKYIDPKLERTVLHKFDLWVLPQMMILFLLAYLDLSNIGKCTAPRGITYMVRKDVLLLISPSYRQLACSASKKASCLSIPSSTTYPWHSSLHTSSLRLPGTWPSSARVPLCSRYRHY